MTNKSNKDKWIIEGILEKNGLTVMNVEHDNWCIFLKDQSKECNCTPDISTEIKKS